MLYQMVRQEVDVRLQEIHRREPGTSVPDGRSHTPAPLADCSPPPGQMLEATLHDEDPSSSLRAHKADQIAPSFPV